LIGINDINSGRTNDEIITNYTAILDGIKANLPSAKMICQSVLPMNAVVENYGVDLPKATAQIKDLNLRIKALAETKGYDFLNLYPSFADEADHLIAAYTDDGLHLNAAGFAVWTSLVKPLL
jgi:lysophospholipase L1-like esterase